MDIFEIAIDPPHDSIYPVRVTTPVGEKDTSTLILPHSDPGFNTMLATLTYRDHSTILSEEAIIRFGQQLYGLLFHGATARLFKSATTQATRNNRPLQLMCARHQDLVPVAAVPWKFLTDETEQPLVTRYSLIRVPKSDRSAPHRWPTDDAAGLGIANRIGR